MLPFLSKCSSIVDLYTSKVYTYSMKSRKQILQKMKLFYDEVKNKRKGKRMRLQVDNEFQQVKIKNLNYLNNADMFTTSLRGGKAFAAEQKIRELKIRIAKLNVQKLKISPAKIIERSTLNMNLMKSRKYGYLLKKLNVNLWLENVLRLSLTCIDLRKLKNPTTD